VLVAEGRRAAGEVRGAKWGDTALGNVKRGISGCCDAAGHGKYTRRYLAGVQYRLNHRFSRPECSRDRCK
jgi:hypothetical protein